MDEFTCRECSRLLYDELEQEFGLCNKCAAMGRDSVKDIITGLEDAIIANQVMIQTGDERIAELEAQLAQATTAVEQVSCKMLKLRHAGTNMLEGTVCAVSAIHDSTTVQFKQGQA